MRALLADALLSDRVKNSRRRKGSTWRVDCYGKLVVIAGAALLVGLPLGAPVYAAPILISAEYTLNIAGSGGGISYDQTVNQPEDGDFSNSLSAAADYIHPELLTPEHFGSAASVSFNMSDNWIEAVGAGTASSTGLWLVPGGPHAAASVSLEFSFGLTEAHFVEGVGTFNTHGHGERGGYSFLSFDGMSAGIGLNPPVPFDLNCDPRSRLCFEGVLPAGTYTVIGQLYASAPNMNNQVAQEYLWFGMSFAPIPEPSTALLLALGLAGLAARRRASGRSTKRTNAFAH